MMEDFESSGDVLWKILGVMWRIFQIAIFFFLFVGLAISQQCQDQVQEACKILTLCD